MPKLKFSEVVSYSSEDPNYPADNLLNLHTHQKWKINKNDVGKQASVTLKLEKLSIISSMDIGNEGSALVEVLVARDDENFKVLLAASSFMSLVESRNQTNLSGVRMFANESLVEETRKERWSKLKVVCTQPFNKVLQFGLSFVTVTSPDDPVSSTRIPNTTTGGLVIGSGLKLKDDSEDTGITIGSLFARRKELTTDKPSTPLTGAAGIRAASLAAAAGEAIPGLKRKLPTTDNGETPVKKRASLDVKKTAHSEGHNKTSSRNVDSPSDKHKLNGDSNKSKDSSKQHQSHHKTSKESSAATHSKEPKKPSTVVPPRTPTASPASSSRAPDNRRTVDITGSTRSLSSPTSDTRSYKPFSSLMKGVTYVMSGYQNPHRGLLRDKMTSMGARYKADWDRSCTHLICAFSNTPKYRAVKGKGKIVKHTWIEDCYTFKKRFPWKRYRLVKDDASSDESETEVWAEELKPVTVKPSVPKALLSSGEDCNQIDDEQPSTSRQDELLEDNNSVKSYGSETEEDTDDEIKRVMAASKAKDDKTADDQPTAGTSSSGPSSSVTRDLSAGHHSDSSDSRVYDTDTEPEEDSGSNNKTELTTISSADLAAPDESELPPLLNCFTDKSFFLYGSPRGEECLKRYIIAFNGKVCEYMSDEVQFVITESDWDKAFDKAKKDNPKLWFVKPAWIWKCSDFKDFVPYEDHCIHPPK